MACLWLLFCYIFLSAVRDDARLLRAAAKVSGKFLSRFGLARSDLTNNLGTHENNNSWYLQSPHHACNTQINWEKACEMDPLIIILILHMRKLRNSAGISSAFCPRSHHYQVIELGAHPNIILGYKVKCMGIKGIKMKSMGKVMSLCHYQKRHLSQGGLE